MFSTEMREYSINFNHLKYSFDKLAKQYQSVEGKDIFLVIGTTGSGKSTFINYMTGCPLHEKIDERTRSKYIESKVGVKEKIKISHGCSSETICPEAISSEKGFNYLECAGFQCRRTFFEESLSSSILTQLAIQQANSIRGIILLHSPNPDSSASFYDCFFKGLEKIINIKQYSESLLFVMTKKSDHYKPKHFIHLVKEFAEAEERGIFCRDTARALVTVVNENNVVTYNPLIESHQSLIAPKIEALKPIPKAAFSFPIFDEYHAALQKTILAIANKVDDLSKQQDKNPLKKMLKDNKKLLDFIHQIATMANFRSTDINNFIDFYEKNRIIEEVSEEKSRCILL